MTGSESRRGCPPPDPASGVPDFQHLPFYLHPFTEDTCSLSPVLSHFLNTSSSCAPPSACPSPSVPLPPALHPGNLHVPLSQSPSSVGPRMAAFQLLPRLHLRGLCSPGCWRDHCGHSQLCVLSVFIIDRWEGFLFYTFWNKSSVSHMHCEYFLPACGLHFQFFNGVFTSRKNLFTTDFWGVRPFCVLRNLCLPVFLLKACSLRDFIQNENSSPNRGPKPHRTGSRALLDLTSRYPPCTPSAPSALAALPPQQACSGLRAFALLPFPYILFPQLLPGQLPHLLQASAPLSILLSPIPTTFPATAGSPSLPALDILALPDLFLTAPSTCILSLGVSTRQ